MLKKYLLAMLCLFSSVALAEDEIHIVHCIKGCPVGAPSTNDLIVREIFTLSNNEENKFADWVAYKVTSETIATSKSLNRDWQTDTLLEDEETLEPNDYKNASRDLNTDRGHQAPLASFAGTIYWRDTNILSNITPQKKPLNQGPWKELEEAVRDAAYANRQIWVVTGPLYEVATDGLPGADEEHKVPSAYWKVIANASGKYAGFIFDQNTERTASYCDASFSVSLEEIEQRSKLDIFPQASSDWPVEGFRRDLGC